MQICLKLLWIGFTTLTFGQSQVENQSHRIHLTLDKAIVLAIDNATGVLTAQNNLELSAARLLQSYGQFLPSLGVSANYGYSSGTNIYAFSGVNVVGTKSTPGTYQISTSLNLFNGLADYSNLQSSLELQKASELSLSWAKQQIAFDVTQTYLQIVLDKAIIVIGEKNLSASQARLRLFRARTEVGQISSADLYRQQAQTSSDENFLFNSRIRLNDDQIRLIKKLRLRPTDSFEFEEVPLARILPALAERPTDQLIESALNQREDFKSLQSSWSSEKWDIKTAQAGYYPRLDLNFNLLGNGIYLHQQILNGKDVLPANQQSLLSQLGNQMTYSVGLSLTWNIFDRFLTRLNVQQARVRASNTEVNLQDLRLQIMNDIVQIKGDYAAAVQQVQSTQVGVQAAEKAFDLIQGQYKVGASSFIDVLAAQSALVQAQATLIQAQVSLKLQEKILDYTVGNFLKPYSSSGHIDN